MASDKSKDMYEGFLLKLRSAYEPLKVLDGQFGAMMEVNIVNDGPVTINLESPSHLKNNKRIE